MMDSFGLVVAGGGGFCSVRDRGVVVTEVVVVGGCSCVDGVAVVAVGVVILVQVIVIIIVIIYLFSLRFFCLLRSSLG